MLSGLLFHAKLLSLGLELQVHGVELLVLIEHLFAFPPLSQSVLLKRLVVPQKQSLDLTDLHNGKWSSSWT